jgi:hypothetical protein
MDPQDAVAQLMAVGPRGATGNGERLAACAARDELRAHDLQARLQTLWLRPAWAWSEALCCAGIVAGSLLSVWQPLAGLAVIALALAALALELTATWRPARLLAPLHATQNVVAEDNAAATAERRVRLVITANLDAARAGAVPPALRRALPVSPRAVVCASAVLLCVVAGLRVDGRSGAALGLFQFALTLVPLFAVAVLLDVALGDVTPGANSNASGVAVALALAEELAAHPPHALWVDVVLSGAGAGQGLGFQRYLSSRRGELRRENTVVLAIEPCGAAGGEPAWWVREGPLLPLRTHPRLVELALQAGGRRHRGTSMSALYVAMRRRLPAIAIGTLGERGGHDDVEVDDGALARTLELCRAFVGALDEEIGARGSAQERGADRVK